MKKAFICGVSGQDGAYLARFLLGKGYKVYGGSRDATTTNFENLNKLQVFKDLEIVSMSISDFRSVLQVVMKIKPDEIYNLAGQSSVAQSFVQPVETLESISIGSLNLLEAIRFSGLNIKLYNAGSSECFGNVTLAVRENSPFRPRSPYGLAKATAFWQVANYREAYNLFACTGILFNHESPLRKERFVTKKIIASACRIAQGSNEKLVLGNINIYRDWGLASEYVEAMWLMMQQDKPDDFIVATGKTMSLKDFVTATLECLNLNMEEHVIYDVGLLRPTDIEKGFASPLKAKKILKWEAQVHTTELVKLLVNCELNGTFD